ncbi:MAG: hypothetical protein KGJ23_03550 [Euryarchaeota archaeon]|nr:hypothetical protein [Euryarchaeota archaeon]MDE1835675.1 hypothetical protein [Euryarchaeota archaeon]MDE1879716.1 hypothetical protein [Euryarchaeota archaeon]MDE2046659.1 hypothetical protein [Thermoplasmata archaeon]
MTGTPAPLPSLTAMTFRRGMRIGRLYLVLGVFFTLFLTVVLLRSTKGAFPTAFPLEIPMFAALGSMGGLMLFTNDRSKGVLEYLIAYGVPPRTLLLNALATATGLTTIVLGAALAVGLGGYVAVGNTLSTDLENAILFYTIPMAYAGGLFASVAGMVWSTLSSPRTGMNSPVGVAPLLGVAPPVLVLVLAEASSKSDYYYITAGSAAIFLVIVVALLLLASRLMGRERFLSPL